MKKQKEHNDIASRYAELCKERDSLIEESQRELLGCKECHNKYVAQEDRYLSVAAELYEDLSAKGKRELLGNSELYNKWIDQENRYLSVRDKLSKVDMALNDLVDKAGMNIEEFLSNWSGEEEAK